VATILLVEDELPIQRLLSDLLRSEGYTVICADHGVRALELIAERRPDLVVTDLMLPIMNGVELCRRVKADPSTRQIPVMAMSAGGRQQALESGADRFLAKPFELEALLEAVERFLRTHAGG
jgi:CheY-like chemotaxis protein